MCSMQLTLASSSCSFHNDETSCFSDSQSGDRADTFSITGFVGAAMANICGLDAGVAADMSKTGIRVLGFGKFEC